MKTEKYLSRIGFYPGEYFFRKSFVKVEIKGFKVFNGFNIYDHRKKVREANGKSELDFFKEFCKDGLVQVVYKKDHFFMNIFDINESIKDIEPELSTFVIPTNKRMWRRNKDIFFFSKEISTMFGFEAIYVYILDTDSTDPRFSISTC